MTTTPTPTGHTGGLVQPEIPQQWAAIGRRWPPASAAGGRRAATPDDDDDDDNDDDDDDETGPDETVEKHWWN